MFDWVLLHLCHLQKTTTVLYSELLWSAFSRIRTEYGEVLRIFPYSVRMRENTDQNNSESGHFFHSEFVLKIFKMRHLFNENILVVLENGIRTMPLLENCLRNLENILQVIL